MKKPGPGQGELFGAAPAPVTAPAAEAPGQAAAALLRPVAPQGPAANAPAVALPSAALTAIPAAVPAWRAPAAEPRVLSVGELTRQIKGTLERGFGRVLVRGEVSGYRGPNVRGHLYFSLKDKEGCLDVKVWASSARRLKFALRDGLSLIADGSLDVYEPQGRYSLIATRLEPEGEGALALAFAQLKERLAAEGLIGEKRKRPPRPVPFLPRRIGVVTSITGAALRDFLRVLHGRHPRLSVLVCDARVQGEGSAAQVVRAIERLSRTDVDVIVITRGGGSIEDLWTFNEEAVARAVFACRVPVVSAIGHEVDFTICDFVADLRSPTPSAAAERLSPVLRDLELSLATSAGRLRKAAERRVLEGRGVLARHARRLADPRRLLGQRALHLSEGAEAMARAVREGLKRRRLGFAALDERLSRQGPLARLGRDRQELRRLAERLKGWAREKVRAERARATLARRSFERAAPVRAIHLQRQHLRGLRGELATLERHAASDAGRSFHALAARLDAMSPLAVLARGYSVTFRRADGAVVRRAADVALGDEVAIRLAAPGSRTISECEEVDATVTGVKGR
ncbi:MAG: exodeoxyribonuclease VII large subunit [Myxococcaceae bacterium]